MKLNLREKVAIASSGEPFAQSAMRNSKLYGVCEARSPPASLNYTTSQRSRYAMELTAAFADPSLSMEIGNYVIASAIGQARRWMIARVPFASIAINLSASQFRDDQLGNRILNAIGATNLDPRMIEVEVTEGVFLSTTSDAVLNACKVLKQGGVRIAFDDFGTGFASLTLLRAFPVDTIKIDRSFITRLGQGQNTTTIVNAMVR